MSEQAGLCLISVSETLKEHVDIGGVKGAGRKRVPHPRHWRALAQISEGESEII
jgi:hypothetical protein